MTNPTSSIVQVAKVHRGHLTGYLAHYGRKLGREIYQSARRSAAACLRSKPKAERKTIYFRHSDGIVLQPPQQRLMS